MNSERPTCSEKLPKEVQALFDAKRLDLFASRPGVDEVSEQNSRIQIVMSASWSRNEDGLKLFEAMNALSKEIALTFKNGTNSGQPAEKEKLYGSAQTGDFRSCPIRSFERGKP